MGVGSIEQVAARAALTFGNAISPLIIICVNYRVSIVEIICISYHGYPGDCRGQGGSITGGLLTEGPLVLNDNLQDPGGAIGNRIDLSASPRVICTVLFDGVVEHFGTPPNKNY